MSTWGTEGFELLELIDHMLALGYLDAKLARRLLRVSAKVMHLIDEHENVRQPALQVRTRRRRHPLAYFRMRKRSLAQP